jgi:predicted DNA-binding transcriptional regulator AlpA
MPEKAAAYYVGLSPSTFRAEVAPNVRPIRLTQGRIAWLREDLDAWLERRAGRIPVDQPAPSPDARPQEVPIHDAVQAGLAALAAKGRSRRPRSPR